MPIVLKSGSLNLREPSGPVQACDGIALPFNGVSSCVHTAHMFSYMYFLFVRLPLSNFINIVVLHFLKLCFYVFL
jgi:hypothetical protein